MEWRENEGVRWLEAALPGTRVAFSTRIGGVSKPPFDSLNLGLLTDDDSGAVRENRLRLLAALGLEPKRVAFARQVHGAELLTHAGVPRHAFAANSAGLAFDEADPPEADGHVLAEPGAAALVFVADCLPVALSGPGGVAMLHCGWRGLAAGILAKGAATVDATAAAIGPGIGPCCYEVGPDVLEVFADIPADGTNSHDMRGISARRHLDLAEVARLRLTAVGVAEVEVAGLCTSCNPDLFFSHRRDAGRTGRQAGIAWIEEAV